MAKPKTIKATVFNNGQIHETESWIGDGALLVAKSALSALDLEKIRARGMGPRNGGLTDANVSMAMQVGAGGSVAERTPLVCNGSTNVRFYLAESSRNWAALCADRSATIEATIPLGCWYIRCDGADRYATIPAEYRDADGNTLAILAPLDGKILRSIVGPVLAAIAE